MITYIKSIPIHFQLPNWMKKIIGIMFHEFWYCENRQTKNLLETAQLCIFG